MIGNSAENIPEDCYSVGSADAVVTIDGSRLTILDIAKVAQGAAVKASSDTAVLERVRKSRQVIVDAVNGGQDIYGVTTLFGGMAGLRITPEQMHDLQKVALWQHKSTTGPRLSSAEVRAAMLLRVNSLMKGASGIRMEIIERYITFLNFKACPHVHQRGSIGASGDLVPLSYIAGAVTGLDPAFMVDLDDETLDSHTALARLGLEPIVLEPKEGLALNNGTAACTGIAALSVDRALDLTALALATHALFAQALMATGQSFHPFIHENKPHPGQLWVASEMSRLVEGSRFIRDEAAGNREHRKDKLIQDRYSLRCLPQYIGPIVDALHSITEQITTEANSANDNPLIDPESGEIYHTGNFLAQYTSVGMDNLRYHIGLLAKHLDTQIAFLVAPEFNHGLAPSLVGNMGLGINVGLKSLQIVGNALMPMIGFLGQSIADRYPTHAEQFNQNINSQAMNSANLARDGLDLFRHYMANALIFAVQAIELRSFSETGSYDASASLSPRTKDFYLSVRTAAAGSPSPDRPMIWNDLDGFIQPKVEAVLADLSGQGTILRSIKSLSDSIRRGPAELA